MTRHVDKGLYSIKNNFIFTNRQVGITGEQISQGNMFYWELKYSLGSMYLVVWTVKEEMFSGFSWKSAGAFRVERKVTLTEI